MSPRGGARSSSHTALVKASLQWLQAHYIVAWKNNTGAFRTEGGGWVRASFPGCSDILGMLPGGRLLAVEVKTGKGALTADQKAFRSLVDRQGGLYLIVRSLDDLEILACIARCALALAYGSGKGPPCRSRSDERAQ